MVDVTREEAVSFLEEACRNWESVPLLSGPDVEDVRAALQQLVKRTRTLPKGSVEKVALAILNSDRAAYGHGMVDSRFKISDSDGYVVNAQAALAALGMKEEGV